ncbi:MAG TPA: preprotein translocase subunit SecE [Solirubrobacteraceae bacterium]|nr:preprotein translocase subunit SecE [Solirubrobacteraceae bacterium]
MARDRKRAKQRRARGGGAAVGRRPASEQAPNGARTGGDAVEPASTHADAHGTIERADLPGALGHAGAEVDEFDAALVRGAGGVPVTGDQLTEGEAEVEEDAEDALQEPSGPSRPGGGGAGGGGGGGAGGGGGDVARPSGAPLRGGNRAVGFLRASWAELQRVQWPDRRQVTQATAVVLGFVAIAGLYLGLADYVAKEIVEFVL